METSRMWETIVEQRLQLHGILKRLTPEQWAHPSLCHGWTVQDVAAHIISAPQLHGKQLMSGIPLLIRYGYNGGTMHEVQRRGRAGSQAILEQYDKFASVPRGPSVVTVHETLVDTLVHTQDILRPLGIEHAMPAEAADAVAHRLGRLAILLGSRKVVRAVRMISTTTDFEDGTGAEVCGPIDELVMLRAGRPARWELLTGPGTDQVRQLWMSRQRPAASAAS